ncbi:Uncharacterised protein [Mannheimia haemolytica]|uniref:hypothetical protein n=1 Tax=Mannheimia haemolytica TaxID=75985 RepID=UPI000DA26FD8|nr:hypothetical protein [Mannheimia haemolytica]SQE29858.1 Uncharacterised protein [Mannheimia haemolytica]
MLNHNFTSDFQLCRSLLDRAESQAKQENLKRTVANLQSLKIVIEALMLQLEDEKQANRENQAAQGGQKMANVTRNWQEIIANLQRFSEMERDRPQNFYRSFLDTAKNLRALEQNSGTEAEKEAFFKEVQEIYDYWKQNEQAIRKNRKLEATFKGLAKMGIDYQYLLDAQAENLKQIEQLEEQLKKAELQLIAKENLRKSPKKPLTTLAGLELLSTSSKAENTPIDKQEAFFYFSVNLQIAEQIPFIYDCVREFANDGQELNAGIETMIELQKAYNRHIAEQFEQLESLVFDKGDLC